MTKDKTAAFSPIDNEQLDSPPSQIVIANNITLYRKEIVLALRQFTSREIAKLTLATDFTVRDLLGPMNRIRDMLWIELRHAMVEEPVALKLAFPGFASDPESHENRALIRKLRRLDPEIAHLLAWVVVAVAKSVLLDKAIRGTISGNFDITEIAGVISPMDRIAAPIEAAPIGCSVNDSADSDSQEFVGSLVGGSYRTHR